MGKSEYYDYEEESLKMPGDTIDLYFPATGWLSLFPFMEILIFLSVVLQEKGYTGMVAGSIGCRNA